MKDQSDAVHASSVIMTDSTDVSFTDWRLGPEPWALASNLEARYNRELAAGFKRRDQGVAWRDHHSGCP